MIPPPRLYGQGMSTKVDKETLGKREFIQKLIERTQLDSKVVSTIFHASLDQIVEEIQAGNKLEFRGCFILGTKVQKARQAQNPKTLEKVTIPKRRVVYFKKGDGLKDLPLGFP